MIFYIVEIRPNIAFFIEIITCFARNPSHAYIKAVKTIFQYFKSFIDYIITYEDNKKNFFSKNYSDFNYVEDKKN